MNPGLRVGPNCRDKGEDHGGHRAEEQDWVGLQEGERAVPVGHYLQLGLSRAEPLGSWQYAPRSHGNRSWSPWSSVGPGEDWFQVLLG